MADGRRIRACISGFSQPEFHLLRSPQLLQEWGNNPGATSDLQRGLGRFISVSAIAGLVSSARSMRREEYER